MTRSTRILFYFVCTLWFAPLIHGQAPVAIHLVNREGRLAEDALGGGDPFITDFKGTGDVTITELVGGPEGGFVDHFDGANSGNNPSYLRSFVGLEDEGTGDGTPGGLSFLHSDANQPYTSWQFDFAQPLTTTDRLVFVDVDINEQYQVQAFTRLADGGYQLLSLGGWRALVYSGETGTLPDATWAAWDPASGTLVANNDGLEEPLNVLTPDQPVDRLIVTKLRGDGASAGFQIVSAPATPATPALPVVTLSVSVPAATVGAADPAQFRLTLDQAQTSTLLVHYTIKGSAINGTDYIRLTGTKKFKPGKTSKPIRIYPQGDLEGAGKKVVRLSIAPGDGYTVGTTESLKVKIFAGP